MKTVKNSLTGQIHYDLEMEDVKVGKSYLANDFARPKYLAGSIVTVVGMYNNSVEIDTTGKGNKPIRLKPYMLEERKES